MLSFFPRGVLDEILNLIESVSEGFLSYSYPRNIPVYIILKSVHRFNRRCRLKLYYILSPGGYFIQQSKTV